MLSKLTSCQFVGEEGGTEDASASAEFGLEDGGGEGVVKDGGGDFGAGLGGVEGVDLADSSADDDGVGVEDVDDDGEGAGELGGEAIDGGGSGGVGGDAGGDVGEGKFLAGGGSVKFFEAGAGKDGLDAAFFSAVAGGAIFIEDVVAPFAGDAVAAGENFFVDDESTADAGAEDDAEDGGVFNSCAEGGLGEGEAVGVVFDDDGAAEGVLEIGLEGAAIEADGVGIFEETGMGIGGAGGGDADAGGDGQAAFFGE